MGGAAITIALQQLKGFLGIEKFTKKTDVISVMQSVFTKGNCHLCSLSYPRLLKGGSLRFRKLFNQEQLLYYFMCWLCYIRTLMGILNDYFDGYYSEEMVSGLM